MNRFNFMADNNKGKTIGRLLFINGFSLEIYAERLLHRDAPTCDGRSSVAQWWRPLPLEVVLKLKTNPKASSVLIQPFIIDVVAKSNLLILSNLNRLLAICEQSCSIMSLKLCLVQLLM